MRLLLAKMMLEGANVLLLDEPTNDLDLMTLRVLEEALLNFDGASLVISHDRALIDRVCSSVLNFEGQNSVVPYASRTQAINAELARKAQEETPVKPRTKPTRPKAAKTGLTWKEKKELEALPEELEQLEHERDALSETLADPRTYQDDTADIASLTQKFEAIEEDIATRYARWESLENRQE